MSKCFVVLNIATGNETIINEFGSGWLAHPMRWMQLLSLTELLPDKSLVMPLPISASLYSASITRFEIL